MHFLDRLLKLNYSKEIAIMHRKKQKLNDFCSQNI